MCFLLKQLDNLNFNIVLLDKNPPPQYTCRLFLVIQPFSWSPDQVETYSTRSTGT